MWTVKYKQHNDSQAWATLDAYDKKSQALIHATRASAEYYRINVTNPDGEIIWVNNNKETSLSID